MASYLDYVFGYGQNSYTNELKGMLNPWNCFSDRLLSCHKWSRAYVTLT